MRDFMDENDLGQTGLGRYWDKTPKAILENLKRFNTFSLTVYIKSDCNKRSWVCAYTDISLAKHAVASQKIWNCGLYNGNFIHICGYDLYATQVEQWVMYSTGICLPFMSEVDWPYAYSSTTRNLFQWFLYSSGISSNAFYHRISLIWTI